MGNALHFASFELRPDGELLRHGEPVRLQELPRRLLVYLVERSGDIVTRDELRRHLWPNEKFVDFEHGLNTAIKKVREALDDSAADPKFLETIPRQGYRFIAASTVAGRRARWRRIQWTVAASLVVIAVAAAVVRGRATPRSIATIAVLPLENVSGDALQDYLADGMTEALITDLGQIPGVAVISRTSVMQYKHSRKPASQIGRELKADALVEGSVMRSSDRVRVTMRLVDATTERPLWSETRERDLGDAMALQDDVARSIAQRIDATVSAAARALPHFNLEAETAYMKGRDAADQYTRESMSAAIAYFHEAIRLEPQNARAWAGLAHANFVGVATRLVPARDALPAAHAAVRRALELDPNLSQAHLADGELNCLHHRWRVCVEEYRRAIALNGSDADAHQLLGYYLAGISGEFPEGIAEMQRAAVLDPLSLSKKNSLAAALFWARRYGDALQILRDLPDDDRNASRRHERLLLIYDRGNLPNEALREMVILAGLAHKPELAASVSDTARRSGYAAARRIFCSGMADVPDIAVAFYLSMIGETDRAIAALDSIIASDDAPPFTFLGVDPLFDPLRRDPRFDRLLERVALDRCSVSVGRPAVAADCGSAQSSRAPQSRGLPTPLAQ